jgi:hypothetical protein
MELGDYSTNLQKKINELSIIKLCVCFASNEFSKAQLRNASDLLIMSCITVVNVQSVGVMGVCIDDVIVVIRNVLLSCCTFRRRVVAVTGSVDADDLDASSAHSNLPE